MALLERISAMKQSGMSQNQIANSLMEEGVSPREVSEAISQSNIKSAVVSEENSGLQPSIMTDNSSSQQYMSVPNYSNQPMAQQEATLPPIPAQQQQYAPQQYAQPQYTQQQYADAQQQQYDPAAYQQQYTEQPQEGYYQQTLDLETVRDIARQQVEEIMKKTKEQVDVLVKSKSELSFQLQDIDNRMKKIEAVIQDIQRAVIRKMGEYGDSISSISGDLKATQQSFSKVLNPLLDKQRGRREEVEEQESFEQPMQQQNRQPQQQKQKGQQQQNNQQNQQQARPRPNSKNSATFEDYFR